MMGMPAEWKILLNLMIKRARELNEFKHASVSQTLPGTDLLHMMLHDKIISNGLYQQLKRLAEDPTMEYNIVIT